MMNAHRMRTHATQMRIVATLLVHTPVSAEMVLMEMVTRAQVNHAVPLGSYEAFSCDVKEIHLAPFVT